MRIFFVLCLCMFLYADSPSAPDFSLSNKQVSTPPPLPEQYGVQMPFENYGQIPNVNAQILPDEPMVLELCVITDRTNRVYENGYELMRGCKLGDRGLSYFLLQPYEYWESLALPIASLVPKDGDAIYPSIVMNYLDSMGNIAGNIEVGISFNANYISINGNMFEQDTTLINGIYRLIDEVYSNSYMR